AAFRSLLPGQTHFNIGKSVSPLLIGGKKLNWFGYTSANDLIDLDAALGKIDYVKGYALAEINADSAGTSFFAVGSDDAIKVWLNGKLIHTNWTARGVATDN